MGKRSKPAEPSVPPTALPQAAVPSSPHRVRNLILVTISLLILGVLVWEMVYPVFASTSALQRAKLQLANYEFPEAEKQLSRALSLRSDYAEAYFLQAQLYRRTERYGEAHRALARSKELGWIQEYIEFEQLLLKLLEGGPNGSTEKRIQLFIDASHPEDRLLMEGLAKAYLDSHFLNEARGVLTQWIDRYPDDWYPHFYRGQIYEVQFEGELAAADYRAVLALNPQHPKIRLFIAALFIAARKDLSEAIGIAEDQIRLHPDDIETSFWLATGFQASGQMDAALKAVDAALLQSPNHPRGLILKASLIRERDPKSAYAMLEKAEQVNPDSQQANLLLSQLARELGRDADAKKYADRYAILEQNENQTQELATEIRKSPHDPDIRCKLGQMMLKVGRGKDALGWYLSALREKPDHIPSLQALAEYYEGKGNNPVQARQYRQAIDLLKSKPR